MGIRAEEDGPYPRKEGEMILFAGLTRRELKDGYGFSNSTIQKIRRGEADKLGPETILRLQRIRGWTRSMVPAEILKQSALNDIDRAERRGK